MVLPCFVGNQFAALQQVGDDIAELAHDQWLVVHDNERHEPRVRKTVEQIAELIRQEIIR